MPTPEEQARALLSSPGLSPDMRSKLEAAINAPSPSAAEAPPDEPAPETQGHVTELPVQQIEGDVPKPRKPGMLEDAAFGWLNGISLGHADDIYGMLAPGDSSYNKRLYRGEDALAQEAHPHTHFAGSLAGGLGPAMAVAPLGPVGGGAVLGAAQSHGDSDDADATTTALNMGLGAVRGAAIGKGLEYAAPVARGVAKWTGEKAGQAVSAGERWFGRALGATEEQVQKLEDSGRLGDLVRTWKKQGVGKGLPTQRGMKGQANDAKNAAQMRMDAVLDKAGDAVVEPNAVTSRMRGHKSNWAEHAEGQPYRDRIDDAAQKVDRMERRVVPAPRPSAEPTLELDPAKAGAEPPPEWFEQPSAAPAEASPAATDPMTALADDGEAGLGPYGKPSSVPPDLPKQGTSWPFDDDLTPPMQSPASGPPSSEPARFDLGGTLQDSEPTAMSRYGIPIGEARKELATWGRETNWESDTIGHEIKGDMYGAWKHGITDAVEAHAPGQRAEWGNANWNKHAAMRAEELAQQRPAAPQGLVQIAGRTARVLATGRDRIAASKLSSGVGAPVLRGVQKTSGALAEALDGWKGQAGQALAAGRGGVPSANLATVAAQHKEASDEGRGQLMPAALEQVLRTNPEALGPFRKQIELAVQKKEPAVWSATISKLERDVAFRRLRPQILELTKSSR